MILDSSYKIIYPDETGTLTFSAGQKFLLGCPGKGNALDISSKSEQTAEATCTEGKTFSVDGKKYPFSSFTCKKISKSIVQENGTCLNKYQKIEIGYDIPKAFIPMIEICRDDTTDESFYAKSEMSKSVDGSQTNSPRPGWVGYKLFQGHSISNFYKKKNQVQVLATILNSKPLAEKYLAKNVLQRGHLSPKVDFVYGLEQNSTFTFANAAPQWTSFNTGNWKHIESAVRNFVIDNDLKATIYTGVSGQMTLKDVNDKDQPIFLDVDENKKGYLKVPKFFWKIIYDASRRQAIVIVGVNDPFSEKITDDMFLCKDISDKSEAAWLTKSWKDRKDIWSGLSYVCSYEDLKKAVPTVPDLKVKGILSSSRT